MQSHSCWKFTARLTFHINFSHFPRHVTERPQCLTNVFLIRAYRRESPSYNHVGIISSCHRSADAESDATIKIGTFSGIEIRSRRLSLSRPLAKSRSSGICLTWCVIFRSNPQGLFGDKLFFSIARRDFASSTASVESIIFFTSFYRFSSRRAY